MAIGFYEQGWMNLEFIKGNYVSTYVNDEWYYNEIKSVTVGGLKQRIYNFTSYLANDINWQTTSNEKGKKYMSKNQSGKAINELQVGWKQSMKSKYIIV